MYIVGTFSSLHFAHRLLLLKQTHAIGPHNGQMLVHVIYVSTLMIFMYIYIVCDPCLQEA